jgi:hypothetical protein
MKGTTMTDKEKIIELQRELKKIKEAADMALFTYCQTDELHSDKIGKTKDAILDEFYTVHDIPVDVQEHLEERFNCHLCVPESDMSSDLFDDLPLPDGKHPCVIDVPARAGGGLNTAAKAHTMKVDVQVLNGQVNIIDIFKLTGAHTEHDPDHRFIESVWMLDKKTITVHYGS